MDLGAVAEDLFPAYYLEVLIADDDGQRWTALTDGFITTTVETAKLGIYAGKDMTGKLAFIATPQLRHVYYNAYR